MYDAAEGAAAVLLLTEWKEFRMPNWKTLGEKMGRKLLIDGRNIYDANELADNGFEYHGIGK